jgi:hypothetical protein
MPKKGDKNPTIEHMMSHEVKEQDRGQCLTSEPHLGLGGRSLYPGRFAF